MHTMSEAGLSVLLIHVWLEGVVTIASILDEVSIPLVLLNKGILVLVSNVGSGGAVWN